MIVRLFFSDSDCDFVEPQTLFLSRKPKASVALEGVTKMTVEVEDVNPPWTAHEEGIQVEVTHLEHSLLGPEDADICIKSVSEGAMDEGGGKKFVLLDTKGKGQGG